MTHSGTQPQRTTHSRQDTGVAEEATTGRGQGRGVAHATGPGVRGRRANPDFRGSGTHQYSLGLKERVRDPSTGPSGQGPEVPGQGPQGQDPPGQGPRGGSEPTRVRPDCRGSGTRPNSLGLKERVRDPSTGPSGQGPEAPAQRLHGSRTHLGRAQGGSGTLIQGRDPYTHRQGSRTQPRVRDLDLRPTGRAQGRGGSGTLNCHPQSVGRIQGVKESVGTVSPNCPHCVCKGRGRPCANNRTYDAGDRSQGTRERPKLWSLSQAAVQRSQQSPARERRQRMLVGGGDEKTVGRA